MDEAGHLPSKNEIPEESSTIAEASGRSSDNLLKARSANPVPSNPYVPAISSRPVLAANSQNVQTAATAAQVESPQSPVLTRSWYEKRSAAALHSKVETVEIESRGSVAAAAVDGKTVTADVAWSELSEPPAPAAPVNLIEDKIGYGGATPDGRDHPFGLAGRMLEGLSRGTLSDWTDKCIGAPVNDKMTGNGATAGDATDGDQVQDDVWASVLGQRFQSQQTASKTAQSAPASVPERAPDSHETQAKNAGVKGRGLQSRGEIKSPSGAFVGAIKKYRSSTNKRAVLRPFLTSSDGHLRINKSLSPFDKTINDENKITQPNITSIGSPTEGREAMPGRLKSRPLVKMHLPDGTYGGGRSSTRGDGRSSVPRYDVALPKYDFPVKKTAAKNNGVETTVDGAGARRPRKAIDELESTAEMAKERAKDNTRNSTRDLEQPAAKDPYTYIVQPGDTIESIARTVLQDPFLAALLFSLNRPYVLPEEQYGVHPLMVGVSIKLPAPAEIRKYMQGR